MSNAVIASNASPVQASNLNASTTAAGSSSDASTEDGDFASVLDAKVTTADKGTEAQTPSETRAADTGRETDSDIEGLPVDLSALLPMIAAQLASTGRADATGKAADETAHADATLQTLTAPTARSRAAVDSTKAEDPSATPAAAATDKTAILAEKLSATAESSATRNGREIQSAVAAPDHALAEPVTPLGQVHRPVSDTSPVMRIETPVSAPRWGDELAQKVMWVANRNDGRAELVLTPPHLGRLEVSVAVKHDGEASLMFVSANQQVRDTLEQSLPRLREILADAGIALGHAGVQSDSAPRDDGQFQGRAPRNDVTALGTASPSPAMAASLQQGVGLVDTFA